MKKQIRLLLTMLVILLACGCSDKQVKVSKTESEDIKIKTVQFSDYLANQEKIDEQLKAESEKGYTIEEPFVVVNPYGNSPLTAVVIFNTDEIQSVKVVVKGKKEENNIEGQFQAETTHIIPVYGLYPGESTQVMISLDNGMEKTLQIKTEPLDIKNGTATMNNSKAYDYSQLTFASLTTEEAVVAYDSEGAIRWYFKTKGMPFKQLNNGHFISLSSTVLKASYYMSGLIEFDLCGKVYKEYIVPGGVHHEIYEMGNGNLLVAGCKDDFSTVEDRIVEVDKKTGEIVWDLNMSQILDPTDGGSINRSDEDWFHNNALYYDETTDNILISGRHVDAIIAVNKKNKTLSWILGDPDGWNKVDKKYFFTPIGENFEWQYAQHNVNILDNGDILLFDNGAGRTKDSKIEEKVAGEDVYSRVVSFHIDTANMTIEQSWEYGKERGAEWYSSYISSASSLGENNYWLTSGGILFDATNNSYDLLPSNLFDSGIEKKTIIDQVNSDELIYELQLPYQTYRSIRGSLYEEINQSIPINEKGIWLGSLGETQKTNLKADFSNIKVPQEEWSYTQTPVSFQFSGTINFDVTDEIKDGYLILVDEQGQYKNYLLVQKKLEPENQQSKITMTSAVSKSGLEGKVYHIYVYIHNVMYDSGYQVEF